MVNDEHLSDYLKKPYVAQFKSHRFYLWWSIGWGLFAGTWIVIAHSEWLKLAFCVVCCAHIALALWRLKWYRFYRSVLKDEGYFG